MAARGAIRGSNNAQVNTIHDEKSMINLMASLMPDDFRVEVSWQVRAARGNEVPATISADRPTSAVGKRCRPANRQQAAAFAVRAIS